MIHHFTAFTWIVYIADFHTCDYLVCTRAGITTFAEVQHPTKMPTSYLGCPKFQKHIP